MAQVYVSMGSNIEPLPHLRAALNRLRQLFGDLMISSLYESPPIGFKGDNFYNLVVSFTTDSEVHTLIHILRTIEEDNQRQRGQKNQFASRTLDLDLLLYDDLILQEDTLVLPRTDIIQYAFVLLPLSELAPDGRHPITGQRYADLWERFAKTHADLKITLLKSCKGLYEPTSFW